MQIECRRVLDEDTANDWIAFLNAAARQHPRQSLRYAQVERAIGNEVLYVMGKRDGEIRAIAMISLRDRWPGKIGYTNAAALSGPVCDSLDGLVSFLRQVVALPELSSVGRLLISPYWLDEDAVRLQRELAQLGWKSSESNDFRQTGLVDLRVNGEEILKRFSKSARRETRRAQRQNIQIRTMSGDEDCAVFYESLNRLRANRGLSIIDRVEAKNQFDHIYSHPKIGVALGAFHESSFVGGLLIYRSQIVAHGRHFTTEPNSLKALSNLRIAPVLWWSGMSWAHSQGCKWMDVEGYNANVTNLDPKYRIYKYKGEFSPLPKTRISENYLIINKSLYFPRMLTDSAKSALRKCIKLR